MGSLRVTGRCLGFGGSMVSTKPIVSMVWSINWFGLVGHVGSLINRFLRLKFQWMFLITENLQIYLCRSGVHPTDS